MKILVVEDEPDLNHIIAKHLQAEGYIVDSTNCLNEFYIKIIINFFAEIPNVHIDNVRFTLKIKSPRIGFNL